MAQYEDDAAPLMLPEDPGPGRSGASDRCRSVERRREPASADVLASPPMPWPVYEFATPEAALLYVAYVQALGQLHGWWPWVCVERGRVRLDLGPVVLEVGAGGVRASAAAVLHAAALDLGARPGVARGVRGGDLRDEEGA